MASREATTFRWKAFAAVVLIIGTLLSALLSLRHASIEDLEARTWDWRMRLVAKAPTHSPIKLITIDQASLDYLADHERIFWQWPRGVYQVVLRYLAQSHARAVAFDILFVEQSSYGVEDDLEFAETVGTTIPVVTAITQRRQTTKEDPSDLALFFERQRKNVAMAERIVLPPRAMREFQGTTLPIRPLLERSAAFGDVEGAPDRDGIYRHVSALSVNSADTAARVLKFPFALLTLAYPERTFDFRDRVDVDGRLAVRFLGPKGTIPTESFANIFISWQNIEAGVAPLIPLENYRDALVIVGMDAPGLLDLRPTPLSPNFPGAELNATVLQNALDNSFIRKPSFTWSVVLTVSVVALLAAITLFLTGIWQLFCTVVAMGGFWVATVWAADQGWWIPLALPTVGMTASLLLCLVTQYVIEGRQHRFIRGAFRHYVSPAVIDRIVEDPKQLQLGGEKRELTIFFSDIQGFTTISESLEANRLVPLLNLYLTTVTDIIMKHGGTVDKYVGDAVVAFWNAPLQLPDHARQGVIAAMEIQQALGALAPQFQRDYGVVIKTRIGLNTGQVSVGNFGSVSRFNYTVIGDAANLASRLEGANKAFGTQIMCAERTYELLAGSVPCRRIGTLKVVGKTKGVEVYEPLTQDHPLMRVELRTQYEQALAAFEEGRLEQSALAFQALDQDPVARAYITRIDKERNKGMEGFNSQWNLTEK